MTEHFRRQNRPNCSKSLFCRISGRQTGFHLGGKCSGGPFLRPTVLKVQGYSLENNSVLEVVRGPKRAFVGAFSFSCTGHSGKSRREGPAGIAEKSVRPCGCLSVGSERSTRILDHSKVSYLTPGLASTTRLRWNTQGCRSQFRQNNAIQLQIDTMLFGRLGDRRSSGHLAWR